MKRTATTAVALLLSAGLAMGGIGFGGTVSAGSATDGGASGCCRGVW